MNMRTGGSRMNPVKARNLPAVQMKQTPWLALLIQCRNLATLRTWVLETFTAAELKEASTVHTCLNPPSDSRLDARGERVVHGISFKKFEFSEGWLGGGISGELYRTFHSNKCYELGFWSAGSNQANFDSDETEKFTKEDAKEVDLRLDRPLNSFRFLK